MDLDYIRSINIMFNLNHFRGLGSKELCQLFLFPHKSTRGRERERE